MNLVHLFLAVLTGICLFIAVQPALGPAPVVITGQPKVEVIPVAIPKVFTIKVFCREDTNQVEDVTKMAAEGFRYIGVLNQNGINCNHVLFGK
jgi:hypothetical protein